jgi:hypothetical protein
VRVIGEIARYLAQGLYDDILSPKGTKDGMMGNWTPDGMAV